MPTTSNFGWTTPADTDLVKDGAAAIRTLGNGIDTSLVDLKGGTTGQYLIKQSNTDLDFTWTTNTADIDGVTATSPLTGGGTSGTITVGIQDATTAQKGAVQLTNSTSSTSTTTAATPNSVKSAYDLAAAAIPNSLADAKGDLIAATANDTPARLAVGNNGETLVADSSATTGLRYTAGNPIPNPVLNSSYQIAQRGTSFTTANAYTLDRWYYYSSSTGRTITRQATGDTTNLPNIQYCIRLQRDSGNTALGAISISQSMESINSIPFAGKTVTFSFYARVGANYSGASSFISQVRSGTGTDQNLQSGYTGSNSFISNSQALTTTWTRYTYTGTMPTTGTEMGIYCEYTPTGTAGANDYVEITGFQIDIGSVALPFRTYAGTIAGELAACQRYYWRTTGQSATANDLMTGWANSTTSAVGVLRFPVTMRGAATGNFGAAGDFGFTWSAGTSTITGANIDRISAESLNLRLTTTGLTTGQGGAIFLNSGTTKWIEASAEL